MVKLIQTLDTASVGTFLVARLCPYRGMSIFDGYPDPSIVTELLAGPDAPVQTWLWRPRQTALC